MVRDGIFNTFTNTNRMFDLNNLNLPMNRMMGRSSTNNEHDSLFDTFNTVDFRTTFKPKIDIHEVDSHYLAWVELPGVKLKDIKLSSTKNNVTIKGKKDNLREDMTLLDDAEQPKKNSCSFKSHLEFAADIDSNKMEASFEDGVLKLAIPKKNPIQESVIQIKAGTGAEFHRIYAANAILNAVDKKDQKIKN